MIALPVLLVASSAAFAGEIIHDASLPSRPTTYVVDDRITNGPIENFRELYVDPIGLAKKLSPKSMPKVPPVEGAPGVGPSMKPTGSLPVINLSSSYAEVEVNGTKVGVIGPLTNGAIHGVKSGEYSVKFTLQNGYAVSKVVMTQPLDKPLVPGGEGARASLDEGWVPTWADQPQKGYVEPPPPPKPKKVLKKRVRIVGKRIEFDGKVQFDTGSADILDASFGLLDDMVKVLVENPRVELIEVQGHTDARGKRAANVKLSEQRAASVVAYLVEHGVAAERLVSKGLGPDVPLIEGEDEESWAKNRRVELHVLKQKEKVLLLPPGQDGADKPEKQVLEAAPDSKPDKKVLEAAPDAKPEKKILEGGE